MPRRGIADDDDDDDEEVPSAPPKKDRFTCEGDDEEAGGEEEEGAGDADAPRVGRAAREQRKSKTKAQVLKRGREEEPEHEGGEEDAPTRIGAKAAKRRAQAKEKADAKAAGTLVPRPRARAGAVAKKDLSPEEKEREKARREEEKRERERAHAKAVRKEKEIMRAGHYFEMRRNMVAREREVREAKAKKLLSREQTAFATQLANIDMLGDRQEAIRAMVHAFYLKREYGDDWCIGEVQVVQPQLNAGYITVLGEDDALPAELRADPGFLQGKNPRRMLFEGSTLLHQCFRVGDIVRVQFARMYRGIDIAAQEDTARKPRWRNEALEDITWQVTRILPMPTEGIPERLELVSSVVRQWLLSLLSISRDLALFCKITQELEMWRRVLMERYNAKATPAEGGLMRWHVLLVLQISSRKWLEMSNMNVLLWSFFNAFTDSRFIKETLPSILQEQSRELRRSKHTFSPAVLLQVAKFLNLYRKHACNAAPYVEELMKLVTSDAIRRQMRAFGDAALVEQYEAVLGKLTEQHDTDNYVDMLLEAARRGLNATKAPSKQELFDFDEENVLAMAGEEPEKSDYELLLGLDEIADETSLDPDKLPKNLVEGAWPSPSGYAQAQFKLLRADAFKEFQKSMHHKIYNWEVFRNMQDGGEKRDIDRPSKIFKLVDVLGVSYLQANMAGRLCYVLRFKHYEIIQEQYLHLMLEKGNLVGLTTDRFKTKVWWVVVSHRDQQLLSQGIVGVEFIKGDPIALRNELTELQERAQDTECWLIEAQNLFFTGYRPVLEALKEFGTKAGQHERCPFDEFLVHARSAPGHPNWVKHHLDIFKKQVEQCIEENTFDPSQERAIRGLEWNFLLVQGPPGTGKSYTGVKMVDVILRTRYAVRDKLLKEHPGEKIQQKMDEIRRLIEEYSEMHEDVASMKEQILKMKNEEFGKALTKEEKATIREKVGEMLHRREERKRELLESDARQNRCCTELMEMQQERQSALGQWEEDSGPIQVITYKNHSLDEFLMDVKPSLEDCKDDPTMKEGLCRFGSRSQCEELERYNIKEAVKTVEGDANIVGYRKMLSQALRRKIDELKNLGAEISNLEALNLTKECMECQLTDAQKRNFGEITEASIARWRGVAPVPALVSLADTARQAQEQELERNESDDDDLSSEEFAEAARKKNWQGRRDMHQSKAEQQMEDNARERFINSFSPVLPDLEIPEERAFKPVCLLTNNNIDLLSTEERAQATKYWMHQHRRAVMMQYARAKTDYIYLLSCVQELQMQVKVDAVQRTQVIGLTTTGCTINKEVLNRVQPSVLIIEEAAEILESQILSCLNAGSIQQLVLIGDHKQLRPITNNYELARHCRLDLSLFERMANNSIPIHNLTNQRRMVPQISQFVRPLYRQLVDDDCLKPRKMVCETSGEVRESGDVPGLGKPVWFWSHESEEEPSSIGLSVVNQMEVRMTVWLVRYFEARGIALKQITVLTPYKGQLRELRDNLEFAGVHYQGMVCTVDRFQGDENDLIIVSLVRNARLTEFIKAPDRMCVTLSRARFGMVVLGNAQLLDRRGPDDTEMAHWAKTMEILKANKFIGETFPCVCDRHPNKVHHVDLNDITRGEVADSKIESFCNERCAQTYRFCLDKKSHRCHRSCHAGAHDFCPRTCNRLLDCGHRCKQNCGECAQRGCLCNELTEKQQLDCGHFEYDPEQAAIDPLTPFMWIPHVQRKVGCQTPVLTCTKNLWKPRPPDPTTGKRCGHFVRVQCGTDIDQVCANQECHECLLGMPAIQELQPFLNMESAGGAAAFALEIKPYQGMTTDTVRARSRASRRSVGRSSIASLGRSSAYSLGRSSATGSMPRMEALTDTKEELADRFDEVQARGWSEWRGSEAGDSRGGSLPASQHAGRSERGWVKEEPDDDRAASPAPKRPRQFSPEPRRWMPSQPQHELRGRTRAQPIMADDFDFSGELLDPKLEPEMEPGDAEMEPESAAPDSMAGAADSLTGAAGSSLKGTTEYDDWGSQSARFKDEAVSGAFSQPSPGLGSAAWRKAEPQSAASRRSPGKLEPFSGAAPLLSAPVFQSAKPEQWTGQPARSQASPAKAEVASTAARTVKPEAADTTATPAAGKGGSGVSSTVKAEPARSPARRRQPEEEEEATG